MNYLNYYPVDLVNGPGVRSTLFVSGCSHQCKGCYNEVSWNPNAGVEFTQELEDRIIADLQSTEVKRKGLSLLGGEPLDSWNLNAVFKLVQRVKRECPDKDIWLWTGYTLKSINSERGSVLRKNLVSCVDVLIDGKFVMSLADPKLRYRGSSNQKIWKNNDGVFSEVVL